MERNLFCGKQNTLLKHGHSVQINISEFHREKLCEK